MLPYHFSPCGINFSSDKTDKLVYRISSPISRAIFSVFETRVWLIFHEKRGSAYSRGFGFQNKYSC